MNENQINPASTEKPHAFTGLFPGDYFIHRFDFSDHVYFAYGLLRKIDEKGRYHADYLSQRPPLAKPETIEKQDHRVVGRITKRGYALARIRKWPNTESGVAAILDFSADKAGILSFGERLQLLFKRN